MFEHNKKTVTQILLTLVVLFSGLAFTPFASLSAAELDWQQFASVYLPTLHIDEDKGQPGSGFIFHGSGYPANTQTTIYVDGEPRGYVTTNSNGQATFAIQTETVDPLGRYYITMAADANTSATNDLRLEWDRPLLTLPPGFPHPIFDLFGPPPPVGGNNIYVSAATAGVTGDGVAYTPDDILVHNSATWSWSVAVDGALLGLEGSNVDAVLLLESGAYLMSFAEPTFVPGPGMVDDSDVIFYRPQNGALLLAVDGSDVGLDTDAEDIDGLAASPDGFLLISTRGGYSVPRTGGGTLTGSNEDLLKLDSPSYGPVTSGTWSTYFDGSDVGLNAFDADGAWVGPNDIYLSSDVSFSAVGLTIDDNDIAGCLGATAGDPSNCATPIVLWDGAAAGLGSDTVDAFHIQWEGAANQSITALDALR